MLSSALAGILRAGAVVLTAGALGGGVYFLVQAGDSQDDTSRLQAPSGPTATVEAPRDLSPPGDLSGPVEVKAPPTPTFPPAPIADPGIDTSDWKTYTSRYGFSFRYPPQWTLAAFPGPDSSPSGVDSGQTVWLMNPAFEDARQVAIARHGGGSEFAPPLDGIKMEISVAPSARTMGSVYDVALFVEVCPETSTSRLAAAERNVAQVRDVQGHSAVFCQRVDDAEDGRVVAPVLYWFELAGRRTLQIAPGLVTPAETRIGQVEAVVASLEFPDLAR
jgi:hypothetical protein